MRISTDLVDQSEQDEQLPNTANIRQGDSHSMPLSVAIANNYDHKERDEKTPQAKQGVSSRYAQAAAIIVD